MDERQPNYDILRASPPRREEDIGPFAKGNVLLAKTLMYFAAPVAFALAIWRLRGLFYEPMGGGLRPLWLWGSRPYHSILVGPWE